MMSDNHGVRTSPEPAVSVEPPSAESPPEPKGVAAEDVKKMETPDAAKAPIVVIPKPGDQKPAVEVPKPVEKTAAPAIKVTKPEVRQARYHTVKQGESLYKIAELYYGSGSKENREVIYNANKKIISNPDVINPGWKLRIPYPEEVAGQN
jgi:nucleoid-associated protein YgaU